MTNPAVEIRSAPTKKIALVGAHGTGKTTLTRKITSEAGLLGTTCRLAFTPEIPRIICTAANDTQYFRRGHNTLLKQLLLLVAQPIFETSCGRDIDILLCDRSLLDHWAYTKALFPQDVPADIEQVLATLIRQHLESYDLIVYIPIEFAVQDDGTREGDSAFQAEIDSLIRGTLIAWTVPFIEIRGSLEARIVLLKDHILKLTM